VEARVESSEIPEIKSALRVLKSEQDSTIDNLEGTSGDCELELIVAIIADRSGVLGKDGDMSC
jgi:hypothetical protein